MGLFASGFKPAVAFGCVLAATFIAFVVNYLSANWFGYPVAYCLLKEPAWFAYSNWLQPLIFLGGIGMLGFAIFRAYYAAFLSGITVFLIAVLPEWTQTLFAQFGGCHGS